MLTVCKIFIDKDGFFIVEVDGKEVSKQNNMVQATKKLYAYAKGQS